MDKIAVTNPGPNNLHIGGLVIRPGCTREVDARIVPDEFRPPAPAAAVDEEPDVLASLAERSVKEITDALPILSADDLARLEQLEHAGKNRKGVHEAITHERLRRASETASEAVAAVLEHTIEQIVELLPAMSAEELDALEAAEHASKQRQGVAEAIAHERARRAAE